MSAYRSRDENFAWQAGFQPDIAARLGALFIEETPMWIDRSRGVDLNLLSVGDHTIACRVRRPWNLRSWADHVTITHHHDYDAPAEWPKIVEGASADWFFYGWASHVDPAKGGVERWRLIDLGPTREWFRANRGKLWDNSGSGGRPGKPPGKRSYFYSFDTRKLGRDVGPRAFVNFRPRWPGDEVPRAKKNETQTDLLIDGKITPENDPATERQITILNGLVDQQAWSDEEREEVRSWVSRRIKSRMTRYEASRTIQRVRKGLSRAIAENGEGR